MHEELKHSLEDHNNFSQPGAPRMHQKRNSYHFPVTGNFKKWPYQEFTKLGKVIQWGITEKTLACCKSHGHFFSKAKENIIISISLRG